MNQDEIQTALLRVCKVAYLDSDFNTYGFYALCEKLKALGVLEEREACAKTCEQAGIDGYGTLAAAAMIRARR